MNNPTDRELFQQARDALASLFVMKVDDERGPRCSAALMALDARLAQPEAEPDFYVVVNLLNYVQRSGSKEFCDTLVDEWKDVHKGSWSVRPAIFAAHPAPTPPVQPYRLSESEQGILKEALRKSAKVIDASAMIPWPGGECPVSGDTRVEVVLRHGVRVTPAMTSFGTDLRWTNTNHPTDIIAYRVVREGGK